MKRIFILLGMWFLSESVQAQNTVLSLEESIAIAIKNNIEVKRSDLLVSTAAINYNQSRANILPSLNAGVDQGLNQGRSIDPFTNTYVNQKISYSGYGLSSNVTLFNGFALRNTIKQYSYAYDAAKLELQQLKDNIRIDVTLAYLQVLNNEELLSMANNQVEVSKNQVKRLEVLNQQGAINPPQLAELKGQQMSDELNVVNAQNALELSKLALLQIMNMPYDKNISLQKISATDLLTKYPLNANEILAKATENLALIKSAELRVKSSEAQYKALRGTLLPVLNLSGQYNTSYSSIATDMSNRKIGYSQQLKNNAFSNINFGLVIPIFNSFQTRNRVRLAQIDIKNAELVKEDTERQLRQQIDESYLFMINATERYKISVEQVNAFAEAFRAAEIRFNAGLGTSVDYILAKNNLERANINLISARYELILRKRVLDYYGGL